MAELKGHIIIDMPDGGSHNDGQYVFANIVLQGGGKETLIIEHEKLGQFILGWMRFGDAAFKERLKAGHPTTQVSYPYRAKELNVAVTEDQTSLTFQVVVRPGFQVDYQVPLDVAEQLAAGLPGVIAQMKSGKMSPPRKH